MTTTSSVRRRPNGFTLLELLVVLAVLGLLAAFAVPRVLQYLGGAKSDAAGAQIASLKAALDLYRLENGRYPTAAEGLRALVEKPAGAALWLGPYLDKPEGLIDPWGRPYGYRIPGRTSEVDIFSLGADGQQGGEGDDADIGG